MLSTDIKSLEWLQWHLNLEIKIWQYKLQKNVTSRVNFSPLLLLQEGNNGDKTAIFSLWKDASE